LMLIEQVRGLRYEADLYARVFVNHAGITRGREWRELNSPVFIADEPVTTAFGHIKQTQTGFAEAR
jgi:hypothetical protein